MPTKLLIPIPGRKYGRSTLMTAGLSAPDTGLPGVRKHPGNENSPALKIPYSSVTVLVFPDFLGSPWPATGPPQR